MHSKKHYEAIKDNLSFHINLLRLSSSNYFISFHIVCEKPHDSGTQQRAKEPTQITEGVEEQEESRPPQNEAAPDQILPDVGQEHVLPDFDSEQVFEPETSARQPEKRQEQQSEPLSRSAQCTPM